ncbi:MAG: tetratricopeptide repeat protein [Bacteroidetes bacterium]|nr:tetratricopeptide repeat protein [Bacteroidota bacterium]
MNKSLPIYVLAFFSLILCCIGTGCGGSDHAGSQSETDVLKQPFLASINDSIRRFPKNAELYLRRAILLSRSDAHEYANADFKKAWQLDDSKENALQYAANLAILGRSSDRLKLLEACIQKFPDVAEFKRLTGEAYIEGGKSKLALDLYENLLKKDSSDFEALYEKGLVLEQMHDTARALLALKRAYEMQPVNTYALELAHIYAETKNPVALQICDEVLSKDYARELVDPFFIKGIYYANTLQYNLAIAQFDSCIRRDWKFTDAYIEKGIAYYKQKNYDEALSIFQLAATVSNSDADAYYWVGRCYEVVNKKEEAIVYYERAALLDKNFTEAKAALKRLKGN